MIAYQGQVDNVSSQFVRKHPAGGDICDLGQSEVGVQPLWESVDVTSKGAITLLRVP